MELLEEHLQTIGLTTEEITVYLLILERGGESVLHISEEAGIPRSTVYLLIESLLAKKLIREELVGKKKRYIPAPPSEIVSYGRREEQKIVNSLDILEKELPNLTSLYSLSHGTPQLRMYQGREDIRRLFDASLDSPEIYLSMTSIESIESLGDELDVFQEKYLKKMIYTKEIVSDSAEDIQYKMRCSTPRNEIRTQMARYRAHVDMMIYGDSICYLSYKTGKPIATIVHDPEIAYFERTKFLIIWETLQK